MAEMAIYYDSSKCTACKGCQVACKQWNQLASPLVADEYEFTKSYQSPLELAPNTWVIMGFNEVDQEIGIEWNFMRTACFHCTDAACEIVCPVGAISHRDDGAVVIDQEKCIGCKYCVNSCPFGVPQWNADENKTFKCWQCQDRTSNGLEPACVTTCPTDALEYGERAAMVEKARARVDTLKERGFTEATTYGIDELDGMHVIMVAHRGLEAHGLKADPKIPDAVRAWEIMTPLGGIAAAGIVGGLFLSFLTGMGYSREEMTFGKETTSSTEGVE